MQPGPGPLPMNHTTPVPQNPFDPLHPTPVADPVEITAANEEAARLRQAELDQREAAIEARKPREVEHLTDQIVEQQIVSEYSFCAWDVCKEQPNITVEAERALRSTTICVLILRNGFPIVGTSVAASPEAYDAAEGRKWARSDAMADLWMCEQYAVQNRRMGVDYVPPVEPAPEPEPVKAKRKDDKQTAFEI